MLSSNLVKALSGQVAAEYYSAYLYLAMSAAAGKLGLKGTSNWLFVQAQEEMAHGTHMYQYIIERGEMPVFETIEKPESEYKDVTGIFDKVLEHEKKVTGRINNIATLAMQENDHACYQFMMWYVNEQVEEESGVADVLGRLAMIGDNKGLLLTFDSELASRVFVNPFPPKA